MCSVLPGLGERWWLLKQQEQLSTPTISYTTIPYNILPYPNLPYSSLLLFTVH